MQSERYQEADQPNESQNSSNNSHNQEESSQYTAQEFSLDAYSNVIHDNQTQNQS